MATKEVMASSRCAQLAVAACRMAIEDAKLPLGGTETTRVGVFMGTSVGTAEYLAENHAIFLEKGIRRVHPLFPAQSYPGVAATQVAITFGIRGPVLCISTGCTSSTDAIGVAAMHLRAGLIDRAVVGGAEAPLSPIIFAAFDRLGVLSREREDPKRASRPFAVDRDGFVLSEGSGACVLETEEAAAERGASPLAEIAGYGATSDGYHPFSPLPTGDEGVRAIRLALDQAGITPADIDHVSAHAIGSKPNDPIEVDIMCRVFGEYAPKIPISANKSMIGHTMGAAGVLQVVGCVQTLRTSTIPPTINLEAGTRIAELDFVCEKGRTAKAEVALSPTFGFGSRNAVLVAARFR